MEAIKEKGLDTLRELIIINNDRFEGYKTAKNETNDSEFKNLFECYSSQSKKFNDELRKLIPPNEEAPASDETKIFGEFYNVWMQMKTALADGNNKAIIVSCETGENLIKKIYDNYLLELDIPELILKCVKKQREDLDKSYALIKTRQILM